MTKKLLALLLAVLMLALALASCGGGDDSDRTTLAHVLMDEGYSIVAALDASEAVESAVSQIERVFVQTDVKTRPSVRNDYIQYGDPIPQGAKEIIVGVTTRPTSQSAHAALCAARPNSSRDWQIKIGNGEVLIVGGSDEAVLTAAGAFCTMLTEDASKYPLSGYDSGIVEHTWTLTSIADLPISQYALILPQGADEAHQGAASALQAAIYVASGYLVPILDDTQSAQAELVLGKTARPISEQALSALEASRPNYAHDSILFAQGTQLSLLGGHTDALVDLVDYFMEEYLSDAKQGELAGIHLSIRSRDLKSVTVGQTDLGRYRIVYAQDADFDTRLVAQRLRTLFYTEFGYYLDLVTDATPVAPSKKEILLGRTNRDGTATVAQDAYAVRIDAADNLYFDAGHYAGLLAAYCELLAALDAQTQAQILSVPTYSGQVTELALTVQIDPTLTWEMGQTTYQNSEILSGFDFGRLYTLVWNDEFDGDTLDAEKWSLSTNANMPATTLSDDESVLRVADGTLQLRAILDNRNARTFLINYSVATHDTMNFSGGYLELRAQAPFWGKGEYPSFWSNSYNAVLYKSAYRDTHGGALYDAGYVVEVDFFEGFSSATDATPNIQKFFTKDTRALYSEVPASVELSYFKSGFGMAGNTTSYSFADGEQARQYHTYGFLWTDDIMAFSVDGRFYYAYHLSDTESSFAPSYRDKATRRPRQFGSDGLLRENAALSVILNNLVIGEEYAQYYGWAREKAVKVSDYDTLFPLCFTVDYLRVYQSEGDALYTPNTVGNGTRFYDSSRYDYALNGAPVQENP